MAVWSTDSKTIYHVDFWSEGGQLTVQVTGGAASKLAVAHTYPIAKLEMGHFEPYVYDQTLSLKQPLDGHDMWVAFKLVE